MAKGKVSLPSIYSLGKFIKKESMLPVYFFCGEDSFAIDGAVDTVRKKVEPLIGSEFDKEIINAEKGQNISDIVDLASQFPFGGAKKLFIVKNFEKLNDKKAIASYINDPPNFTIMVISQHGKTPDVKKEPYASIVKNNYLFEARKLKGEELVQWVMRLAKKKKLILEPDTAHAIVDMVGEDKSLLEMQLHKFYDYLGEGKEVTFEIINQMVAATKEYSIFDLQDALGKGNKARSIEIAYNLLDNGKDPVYIFSMLSRYITTIAHSFELSGMSISDYEKAKEAGVSYFYYKNCQKAKFFFNYKRLINAARSLYKADLTLKTSAIESKSLLAILVAQMLEN